MTTCRNLTILLDTRLAWAPGLAFEQGEVVAQAVNGTRELEIAGFGCIGMIYEEMRVNQR